MAQTYHIAVLGDSIAWGQGLFEYQKYYSLIAQAIHNRWRYDVSLDVLAHSGAKLVADKSCPPLDNHEVPTSYPSIFDQADALLSKSNASDIDLILLNGGINDIGVSIILDPSKPSSVIYQGTKDFCHDQMLALLIKLTKQLPEVQIIVLGYYPILSFGASLSISTLGAAVLGALGVPPLITGPITGALIQSIGNRSSKFSSEANMQLSLAIDTVNNINNSTRVFFANPNFKQENTVFGSNPFLFAIKPLFSAEDDPSIAKPREDAAKIAASQGCHKIDLTKAPVASCGHPNAKGAIAYSKAIWPFLKDIIEKKDLKTFYSVRRIASIMDPANPPTSVKVLARHHRWLGADVPQQISLRTIINRHVDARTTKLRFLSYNTCLMDIWGIIPAKRDVNERAQEIGAVLARDYDLAALCEVWSDASRDQVLEAWKNSPHQLQPPAEGPQTDVQGGRVVDSGLLTCGVNHPISVISRYEFTNTGVHRWVFPTLIGPHPPTPRNKQLPGTIDEGRLIDSDQWSTKGVLLTQVDVGVGMIDIYSTHLYSGGDLNQNPLLDAVTDKEMSTVRRQQIDELAEFFNQTHSKRRQNIAIITGDFNIDANDQRMWQYSSTFCTDYKYLQDKMASCGMRDEWYRQCIVNTGQINLGYTGQSSPGDANFKGGLMSVFENVNSPDDGYCKDPDILNPNGRRHDFLFVELPTAQHSFNLDLSRIRRRHFKRPIPGQIQDRSNKDYILDNYMSDHLGLDVTLIASPHEA